MKNRIGQPATVREIRSFLYYNASLYAVIGENEMSNAEARGALHDYPDQQKLLNYFLNIKSYCLHIW